MIKLIVICVLAIASFQINASTGGTGISGRRKAAMSFVNLRKAKARTKKKIIRRRNRRY